MAATASRWNIQISRVLCDARILNIFEGAAEIQAQVIARRLLDATTRRELKECHDRAHPIDRLFATIAVAQGRAIPKPPTPRNCFRTASLRCAKKLGEEGGGDRARRASRQDKAALTAESADLLYHLLVLWAACGIEPDDAYAALEARAKANRDIEEKASRES